jgi:hypothetical protein
MWYRREEPKNQIPGEALDETKNGGVPTNLSTELKSRPTKKEMPITKQIRHITMKIEPTTIMALIVEVMEGALASANWTFLFSCEFECTLTFQKHLLIQMKIFLDVLFTLSTQSDGLTD